MTNLTPELLNAEIERLLDRERELNEAGRILKIRNAKLRSVLKDYAAGYPYPNRAEEVLRDE